MLNPMRGALGAAACLLITAATTQAHVVLETKTATAGTPYKAVLQVLHGCHGAATTAIEVQVPDGIVDAKPMPKPGWTLAITKAAYPEPIEMHGMAIKEGVKTIRWSGGSLPDDNYDEFVFNAFVTPAAPAGEMIYVPVVQTCGLQQVGWTQVPQPGETAHLRTPAAALRILAADTMGKPEVIKAGALEIIAPWIRATPGGAKVAGGYLRITNTGSEPDRLTGASIPLAARGDVHEMLNDNGVMRMRPVDGGLEIKPGATVELKPGGYHLMFEDLSGALKQGETIKGSLTFAKAGTVPVTFAIGGMGATGAPGGDMGGMSGMGDMHDMHMH